MVASSSSRGSGGGAGATSAARIAIMNSDAEAKRSSGRLAIARRITGSNALGAVTEICDGISGSTFSTLCMIEDMLPSNGRSPVSN